MSAVFGVFRRDGAPVEAAWLDTMAEHLAHRAHGTVATWMQGEAGLGVVGWGPDKAAGGLDASIFAAHDGRVQLAATGRLDVAGVEPCAALHAARRRLTTLAGPDHSVGHISSVMRPLDGDFAVAVWDAARRELTCLRDPFGMRPLYVLVEPHRVAFASEMGALLALPGCDMRPDEAQVLARLHATVAGNAGTLYRAIRRVEPGTALRWSAREERAVRWYTPAFGPPRSESVSESVGRFRAALDASVARSARSSGPVVCDLSGGLDSSAVVATLRAVAPETVVEAHTLRFPGFVCDEGSWARDVARWCAVDHHEHRWHALTVEEAVEQVQRYADVPDYPNGAMAEPIRAAAQQAGARIYLGGMGGDEWLTGSWLSVADALGRGNLRQAWRATDSGAGDVRGRVRRLARNAARAWFEPLVERWRPPAHRPMVPWLGPKLRRFAEHSPVEPLHRPAGATWTQAGVWAAFRHGWTAHAYEMEERAAAVHGLEVRAPFNDRRLVDAVMMMPEDRHYRGADAKWVVREAMRDRLPAAVAWRRQKPSFDQVYAGPTLALASHLESGPWLSAERGWVDLDRLLGCVSELSWLYSGHKTTWPGHTMSLWCALALELWLRERL